MSIRADESRYPLLVLHFDPPVTDADMKEQAAFIYPAFERLDRERRKGVLIVNNAPGAVLTASQRRAVIDDSTRHKELMQRACLGIGIVVHSPVQRGVLTAISWLLPSPAATPFASLVEAEQWARAKLGAR